MGQTQAFGELARALHHARYREALQLIDALMTTMPDAGVLRRQREQCLRALAEVEAHVQLEHEIATAVATPELIRVDPRLFGAEPQAFCEAPARELAALGFVPLLDAASPDLARDCIAPVLVRFYADGGKDALVVCFSAPFRTRVVRLLACVAEFDDGAYLLTHRGDDLRLASDARVDVLNLPRQTSLAELVTRHAGRVAMRARQYPRARLRPLATLGDCDRVWRMLAGT